MDISLITSTLVGIKNAIDIARLISSSDISIEKAEIKLKMSELISALADAKISVANIKDVMLEKDAEIDRLKSELDIKRNMIWESPYYFMITEEGKDGPFCQKCYDSSYKLIRLQMPGRQGYWLCKECDNDYTDSSYVQQNVPQIVRRRNDSPWSI